MAEEMITVPAKRPETCCLSRGNKYACNRREGHTGRHYFVWYGLGGRVRGVWGER